MNFIILYFISGTAFIWGNGLILLGTAATIFEKRVNKRKLKYLQVVSRCLMIIGSIFILLSSPAVPFFFIQVILLALISLIFGMKLDTKITALFLIILRLIIIGLCSFLILKELPYRKPLIVPPLTTFDQMYVIGDSISAGIGFDQEKTWIDILQDEDRIELIPFVAGGATLDYAVEKADFIDEEKCLVFLEIGGNDILRKTNPDQFAKKLEALFKKVTGPQRIVIMFELPLPPFNSTYGYTQRYLARQYNVHLIPRRFMAGILTKKGTTDGLHLSNEGHQKMADLVKKTIKNVLPK